jgi:ABC-type multidrug transport system fused ATPase/permease subunit
MTRMSVTQGFTFYVGLFSTSLFVVYDVLQGNATTGDFVTVFSCMVGLQGPMRSLLSKYGVMQSWVVGAERLVGLLNEKPETVDAESVDLVVERGEIKFEDLNFSYDDGRGIIKDFNFRVSPGDTVALVGATGSGKSTIFKLLESFYRPTAGKIYIDGQDLGGVNSRSLRRQIGVVPQVVVSKHKLTLECSSL